VSPRRRSGTFFCDTSVLVAASDTAHQHHRASLALVTAARPGQAFCAAHTLAELYAVLTATPAPRMRRTADVLANVEHAASVFTAVALEVEDYRFVLRHTAGAGIRSGNVYDGLILKAAERSEADAVYTWNVPHFLRVAWPGIVARIRAPQTL